ncbi:Fe-S cluster assembly protein SufD [Enterovirga rhinocerotis]|uniref:Fe-S cluster assembly protein SufD n=1 Tax=Enterovirga rhinocerotis TaxID=1339210 RepID=A0A4V3DXD0_9HYPH|nr:Fe-S cluster assembly protein SufD [Enterovirga rhinocerotis]TDR88239.1 Fe-S cluster assembly protein SufD [Enterovirga rhinocerotis]
MTEVTQIRTAAETGLGDLFDRLKGGLPGDVAIREAALAGFRERGLPHRRVEEFKYFDLRALMREAAPPAERPNATEIAKAFNQAKAFASVPAYRLTFVNGHLAASLKEAESFPSGIEVVPFEQALGEGHPLLASLGRVEVAQGNPILELNTAFMNDGAVIRVAAGATPDQPIALRFVSAGETAFSTATRVLVVVEAGAKVTLIESHEGPDGLANQTNTAVEFVVGDGASVDHVRFNGEGADVLSLSTITATLGADVSFSTHNALIGSAAARHQVFLACKGENSTVRIDGISLLRGRQHADATLVVDHAVPHCTSRETFKTILDGETTGVFQGKIVVRPHAQKTDGGMKSDALLLSERASMNNKPELEIFADDVVCGHGATCGALDDELLFYLKSRGLPKAEAESLLLQAFVGPPIEAIEHEGVRDALVGRVEEWLAARR